MVVSSGTVAIMGAVAFTGAVVITVAAPGSSEARLLVRWPSRHCRSHLRARPLVLHRLRRVTTGVAMAASPTDTALLPVLRLKAMTSSMALLRSRGMNSNTGRRPNRAITNSMGRRLVMASSTGLHHSRAIASNTDHRRATSSTGRRSSKGITTVTDPRHGPPQFIAPNGMDPDPYGPNAHAGALLSSRADGYVLNVRFAPLAVI